MTKILKNRQAKIQNMRKNNSEKLQKKIDKKYPKINGKFKEN